MEKKISRLKIREVFIVFLLVVMGAGKTIAQPQELYPILFEYSKDLYPQYKEIPEDRRYKLEAVADYLKRAKNTGMDPAVLFIGTNQSTRSIMAQAWAFAAAFYYGFDPGKYFSGGLNEGPISTNAIRALERAGFIIYKMKEGGRVYYRVKYSFNIDPVIIFPKKVDDRANPMRNFMSVFVGPSAAQNLPMVKGSYGKVELFYDDPLGYDETGYADEKYDEICHQIALEMFYLFSQLKHV